MSLVSLDDLYKEGYELQQQFFKGEISVDEFWEKISDVGSKLRQTAEYKSLYMKISQFSHEKLVNLLAGMLISAPNSLEIVEAVESGDVDMLEEFAKQSITNVQDYTKGGVE